MNLSLEDVLDIHRAKEAWSRVRGNRGSAGIDGITIQEIEASFPELWAAVVDNVLLEKFTPLPVKRVDIPKANGGERQLGIPCVMDRVLAQCLHLSLSPLWEDQFSPMSFAYRPGRTPIQALRRACSHIQENKGWLLHLDIQDFFGTVPHTLVLHLVYQQVEDYRVTHLIEQLLTAGVFHQCLVTPTDVGLHQGSPLSPLLANIALDELDLWLHEKDISFVRYADDILLCLATQQEADALYPRIVEKLHSIGLRLNDAKTSSRDLSESQFLGFMFHQKSGQTLIHISEESMSRMKETIYTLIETYAPQGAEISARQCAKLLRSWRAYYGQSDQSGQLTQLYRDTQSHLCQIFPSQLHSDDPSTTILLQSWGISLHDPAQSKTKINYDGSLPRQVNWPNTFKTWVRRLPRQRAIQVRVNLGPSRKKSFRTRSVSVIIFGHEIRYSL